MNTSVSYDVNEANLTHIWKQTELNVNFFISTAHIRVTQLFVTERVWRKSYCEFVKMSKVQTLRAFVNQRLTAAAEEIFELFERMMAEYEETLCRKHSLNRADIQQLLVSKAEVPPEWNPSLDQEDPPELPHIKEEQEELWTSQEGEQLQGLEEADITKLTFTPVHVKSEEDDEEQPQSSQLHQSQINENRNAEHLKTEADGEDCGGTEPDKNLNPDSHLQAATHDEMSHSSDSETDDSSCDWQPQSGLKPLQNNEVPASDIECNYGKTSISSPDCATSFGHTEDLHKHDGKQTGVKSFSCSFCSKIYHRKKSLTTHMRLHSEGKRFSCSVCEKTFQWRGQVVDHMRIHTGEKPFSCSFCGTRFTQKTNLTQHLLIHTGEKPFSCSVCGKRFAQHVTLRRHLTVHTGEKPFSCSICDKRFSRLDIFKKHKCVGESSGNK